MKDKQVEKDYIFTICSGVGFQVEFPSKVVVSIQFGPGHYCSNHNPTELINLERYIKERNGFIQCDNAEIALFKRATETECREWLTRKWDDELENDVKSYCGTDDLMSAMEWAKNYKE